MMTGSTGQLQAPRRGFTLVELLVVIAIIGILSTLILVAVRSAYRQSLKTDELSRIRQLGNAWLMYSGAHNDKMVPGWLSPGVQETWKIAQVYPDLSEIPPAPDFDPSRDNVAGSWTWHLVPYMDNPFPILRGHFPRDQQQVEAYQDMGMEVAYEPGFGYNGWYLGGQWDFWDPHYDPPQMRFANVEVADGTIDNPVVRNIPSLKHSTEVVAFCSSFNADGPMSHPVPGEYVRGSWLVEPRLLAGQLQWEIDDNGNLVVRDETHAPLGRNDGPPACWFTDGHTASQTFEELTDQRRWIDRARRIGTHEASDYTHADDD